MEILLYPSALRVVVVVVLVNHFLVIFGDIFTTLAKITFVMAEIMDGYHFWKQIDDINPYGTAAELSKRMGINYYAMKQWRADSRIPKAEALLSLSQVLNRSIEFLLTGENSTLYNERITAIADRCQKATEEELFVIETVLGLSSKATVINKDELQISTEHDSGKKPMSRGNIA